MTENNGIVYQARLHWVLFCWPILLGVAALILGDKVPQLRELSWIILGFSVIWEAMVWLTYQFSYLTIKRKQVILCSGFFIRQTIDIPLNKIESVDIRQTLLGSMLHYGTLVITGTGGTRQLINYLNKPLTCRRYIEQLLHS